MIDLETRGKFRENKKWTDLSNNFDKLSRDFQSYQKDSLKSDKDTQAEMTKYLLQRMELQTGLMFQILKTLKSIENKI